MTIPTVTVYGIPVSKMNMEDTVRYLTDVIRKRKPHQVITANPIMVMAALEDPEFMSVMRGAELVVPDGSGLVWATKAIGDPVAERVTGFDLVQRLLNAGNAEGWKLYLVGAAPDVIKQAADRLGQQYPGIRIVGVQDGYFKKEDDMRVIEDIRRAEPDILLVGRSAATQEPWISEYKDQLQVPIMMGVRGSFDVIAGKLTRAPALWQRLQLEWLYRLLQEPWRYKRMLTLPKFAVKVLLNKNAVRKP